MIRLIGALALCTLLLPRLAMAQQPVPGPAATPADYILLTVFLKHDQSKNLDELNKIQEESGILGEVPAGRHRRRVLVHRDGPRSHRDAARAARALAGSQPRHRAHRLEVVP